MLNFQFYNPTKIIFGENSVKSLPEHLPSQARVMLLYGGQSAVKNGTLAEVKAALGDNFYYEEFGGIEPNPRYETLLGAVEQAKKNKIDYLLAIGGGSVIDGTKFVALASLYYDDPWNILTGKGDKPQKALPIGTILTMPATGSEMNNRAVITRSKTQEKLSLRSDLVFPHFSILDPTKTYSLPVRQLANGLADSFMHTLEQYLTYPVGAKVADAFSEGVLRTIIDIAPDVMTKKEDYSSRANFMWAATVALNGFLATGVPEDWATHRIGHELTALYNIDHACTLAIVLPALLQIKKADKHEKLLQYASNVWGIKQGSDNEKVEQAISKTTQFFESLGIKTKLADYGVKKEIDLIISRLELHKHIALGEQKDITLNVSRQILELI